MSYLRLDDVFRPGFSKTARSCPGHREAVRDRHDWSALAIGGRRLADDCLKTTAEGAQAVEAYVEADVGDAAIGRPQQEHRPLNATALEIAVRCLTARRAKRTDEMRLRDIRDLSEGSNVERLGVGTIHGVTGAKHPAIGLLLSTAHRALPGLKPGVRGWLLRLRLARPTAVSRDR